MTNRILPCLLVAASACVAATASDPGPARANDQNRQESSRMLDRAEVRRRPLPSIGEPGRVAAADVRFARTARDEGQWTAFARFAAPGAQIHGADGPFEAAPWLAAQANPARSVNWAPTAVWTSCDGTLAVSFGRFIQPDAIVGSYATVWALQGSGQRNRDYEWTYDMGGPDNPQPDPPAPPLPPSDDLIVVPALDFVDGKVADCARGTAQPELPPVADGATSGGARSDDGTLQWRWEHRVDGTRALRVDFLRQGRWETALDFVMPPEGARR